MLIIDCEKGPKNVIFLIIFITICLTIGGFKQFVMVVYYGLRYVENVFKLSIV